MDKFVYIDFEFNNTKEKYVNLVCCSLSTNLTNKTVCVKNFWLKDCNKQPLIDKINELIEEDYIFISYSVVAEARCFISLGIDPTKVKWIDLFLEYRCLMNHSDLQFGKHLIDGKIHRNPSHRFDKNFKKPSDGLASACYKLLDVKIDTDHKDFMRDVIIDGRYIDYHKDSIMEYCESDIKYLPQLLSKMLGLYKKRLPSRELKTLKDEMLLRGEYAARTAVMESLGYPIDVEATRNFAKSVTDILNEIAEDINEQFPDLMPFEKNRATRKYVFKQAKAKEQIAKWCEENDKEWDRSDKTNDYSLSVDAYSKHFHYRHDFPRNNYFAQVLRYKKSEQHCNGFKPKPKPVNCWEDSDILKMSDTSNKRRRTFFDAVGSDGRVRPYFNIYGAQSSRSQPPATYYMFLKAAWMRSLVVPDEGKCIVEIDYSQQEIYVKALLSNDPKMIQSYESGDVYLHFAKLAGAVPRDGTKAEYKKERDLFKATVLAIQFGMTKFGLSTKLTNDTGIYHDEDQAQDYIDMFYETYPMAEEHDDHILESYNTNGYLRLRDGWYMWGENPNERSTKNCPVQGFGGDVMRRAVGLAQDRGLDVILTLHDALMVECDVDDRDNAALVLAECMDEAFQHYFGNKVKIRLDSDIWGPGIEDKHYTLKYSNGEMTVHSQPIFIDGRSAKEYERFNKYFVDRYRTDLL